MNCLAETKSESDTTEVTCGHTERSRGVIVAVTPRQQAQISNVANCTKEADNSSSWHSQKESSRGVKRIIDMESAGFSPLKHYLNSLYGIAVEDPNAKVVRIIEPSEEDYFDSLSSEDLQNEKEIECWRLHRQCFAWSFSLGSLILLLGVTSLALGFLLPRHSALVNHLETNFKDGTSSQLNNGRENILDRKAVEHNNVLDTMKVSGGMAVCFGCLLLLVAFIYPPGSHPLKWIGEEAQQPNIIQLNEALRNCGF